ncbi:MAG: TetR/AcrR family transcriptional regulator [Thermodesulfobacteriota bacterium]|nr:TetR/AcrR family transcriptional regulator [Thermodesulfobacteriota bacterium]
MTESHKKQGVILKDEIINIAIDLFAAKGFRGTSIRDIAKPIGISISTIYHYFGNKEGLILAVMQHSAYQVFNKLLTISKRDMDPLDRFKLLMENHIYMASTYMKKAKIINIVSIDKEHLSDKGNEIARKLQRDILDIYIKELGMLEKCGYIHARSITVLAFNVLGIINWLIRWYRTEGPLSLEEVSQEIISFVLNGILDSQSLKVDK